jgi:hypothetical protein
VLGARGGPQQVNVEGVCEVAALVVRSTGALVRRWLVSAWVGVGQCRRVLGHQAAPPDTLLLWCGVSTPSA